MSVNYIKNNCISVTGRTDRATGEPKAWDGASVQECLQMFMHNCEEGMSLNESP